MKRFDDISRVFLPVPKWCGGFGLAPLDRPVEEAALPERRPGRMVETPLGMGQQVLRHECAGNFWTVEGYLIEGIFYQK